MRLLMCYVQVSRTPGLRIHPRAPTAGVGEAPRHEIAGSGPPTVQGLYGDLAAVGIVGVVDRAGRSRRGLDLGIDRGLLDAQERRSRRCLALVVSQE
jgi:hypothetical protein